MRVSIFFLSLVCFGMASVCAQSPSIDNLYYIEDKSLSLTFEEVIESNFTQSPTPDISMGFLPYPVWVKVVLNNHTGGDYYINVGYALLDSITCYIPDQSGTYSITTYGDKVSADQRAFYTQLVNIPLPNSPVEEVYIKVYTEGAMKIPLTISSEKQTVRGIAYAAYWYGIFYGILLIMFLYNFLLFIIVKDFSYLFYCGHILFYLLFQLNFNGHAYLLIPQWLHHDYANSMLISTLVFNALFASWFTINFLSVKKGDKWSYIYLQANVVFGIGLLLLMPVLSYQTMGKIVALQQMSLAIGLIVIGWRRYLSGHHYARYYVLGWTILFLGIIVGNARILGYFQGISIFDNINNFGAVLEIVLLSFALADRVNYYKRQQKIAQENSLALAEENQNIIKLQNDKLEQQVKERTIELVEKQHEIEAQNEEISAQNNELSIQREKLQKLAISLEEEVFLQTDKLQKSNKELAVQNSSLQQFAYVVAHNIRSPIARLLGLTSLFELEKHTEEEHENMVHMIRKSSLELDEVISDVNKILDLDKSIDSAITKINIGEKIDRIASMLETEIKKHQVSINTNLAVNKVSCVDPYIESVLYNLINNAIKFSREGTDSYINIATVEKEGSVHFSIEDNGVGMDMSLVKDKLFQLYQRFDTNTQGKGMGLYLVKSQVSAMGGDITCQSKQREGTTFTFWIPKR